MDDHGVLAVIGHLKAVMSPRWRFRSAVTGEFVSKAYALLHPSTTVKEKVR